MTPPREGTKHEAEPADTHLETTRLAIRRLLLATDFSETAERACAWAVAIAKTFGSKLFLLNALMPVPYIGESGMDPVVVQQASMDAANEQMKVLAARPEMQGLDREEIFVVMPPVEAILRAAEMHKIDLIVMGSHGASGLEKLVIGSVAEAALRQSPSPVLIIGPQCKLAPKRFESIVFATDLDAGSLRAAQYAAALAEEANARITLLHVVPKNVRPEDAPDDSEMRREMQRLLPADAALWSRPSLRVEHGDADRQVLQVAGEQGADLIVMGTRASGPLSDHVPWSTVSRIIRGASCPVMVVRAHAGS